jgi:hypothetical protein
MNENIEEREVHEVEGIYDFKKKMKKNINFRFYG